MKCGSCLQGCPDQRRQEHDEHLHPRGHRGRQARPPGGLAGRARPLRGPRRRGLEATGVEYTDAEGGSHTIEAGAVVVAAGALNTPQILIRSGLPEAAGNSPSSDLIGRNLGLHPAAFVFGLFDEVQDAHRVYPITSHCMDFMRDEDGGFVLEASTIQDPIGFATSIADEDGPMWGERLVEAVRQYRHWNGILVLANDENNGRVVVGEDGAGELRGPLRPGRARADGEGPRVRPRVMEAAGAKRVAWTGPPAPTCRGPAGWARTRRARSWTRNCESHDAKRLFVGDASLFPKTLSVNPSLTIMALADRLAQHLDEDPNRYLSAQAAEVRRREGSGAERLQPPAGAGGSPRARDHAAEPGAGQDRGGGGLLDRPARDRRRDGAGRDGRPAGARPRERRPRRGGRRPGHHASRSATRS